MGAASLEPVGRTRRTQRKEHDDERRGAITPSSRRMISATIARCSSLGQLAHRLGVSQLALVEDRLRGADAQLLGHESDREREQRVEIEETVARVLAGQRQRSRSTSANMSTEPCPTRSSSQKALLGSQRYQRQPPSTPGSALSAANASAPATTAAVNAPTRGQATLPAALDAGRRHAHTRASPAILGIACQKPRTYRADCHYVTLCHKR